MSDAKENAESAPPRRSRLPLILGLFLALVGGGGGFYAAWSGMLLGTETADQSGSPKTITPVSAKVAYVDVDPLVVSLRNPANAKHLRFRASLEVPIEARPKVEELLPRVIDVLNSYLRAVEAADLENPAALTRLRAQMLRRIQVVTGMGKVNDLLIMEFVLT